LRWLVSYDILGFGRQKRICGGMLRVLVTSLRRLLRENPVFTWQKNSWFLLRTLERKLNKVEIKFPRKNVSHCHNFPKIIVKNKLNDIGGKMGNIPNYWFVFTLWTLERQNTRNVWKKHSKFPF